jgi:hypothetical protein
MGLFNFRKTAKNPVAATQPVAAPTKEEVEAEMRDLLSNQAKISNMIGKPIKTSTTVSDDELMRELAELERQYGSSRGGAEYHEKLRAILKRGLEILKEFDRNPGAPDYAANRKRLTEILVRGYREYKRATGRGARRTNRKKSTRRRRVRRSS